LPCVKYVISQDDAEAYHANLSAHNIEVAPKGVNERPNGIITARNYVLKKYKTDDNIIVLLDDDLAELRRFEDGQLRHATYEEFLQAIFKMSIVNNALGFEFFTINLLGNEKVSYISGYPYTNATKGTGQFLCFTGKRTLKYSDEILLKEDLDIGAKHFLKYGGLIKYAAFVLKFKPIGYKGGLNDGVRNMEREIEDTKAIIKKYPNIYRLKGRVGLAQRNMDNKSRKSLAVEVVKRKKDI
jgi:hypothetical protein